MTGDDPTDYAADLAGFGVPSGRHADAGRDELERLASRMAERVRRGGSADDKTATDDPSLAARLREIAPVIEALERWKVTKETESGEGELPAVLPVDRLGEYGLVREIGRGGNAIVFEAVQESTGQSVAVKVFPRRAPARSPSRQRFLEEAATMWRLRHPHVVPVLHVSEQGDYPFYVMRLAEGGSLDRVIGRLRRDKRLEPTGKSTFTLGREDWRAFAGIGVQVARAIAFAHASGVLHGDMKPANVLLDARGQVMVADFGPRPRPEPEARGRLTGTYRYMAPERFDGICDERSDVYSLGATLYELVVLTPAFEGEGQESLVRSVLRHELVAPKLVRSAIPAELNAIVIKAMARDPETRYRSAGELAADLLSFLDGRPVAACAPEGLVSRWLDPPYTTKIPYDACGNVAGGYVSSFGTPADPFRPARPRGRGGHGTGSVIPPGGPPATDRRGSRVSVSALGPGRAFRSQRSAVAGPSVRAVRPPLRPSVRTYRRRSRPGPV